MCNTYIYESLSYSLSSKKKMSTTTVNQVSSPYAIYENETKIASIPYEVLRVASQFVSKDYAKHLLMGVHLKIENDEITVASTDGHRLFYFMKVRIFLFTFTIFSCTIVRNLDFSTNQNENY